MVAAGGPGQIIGAPRIAMPRRGRKQAAPRTSSSSASASAATGAPAALPTAAAERISSAPSLILPPVLPSSAETPGADARCTAYISSRQVIDLRFPPAGFLGGGAATPYWSGVACLPRPDAHLLYIAVDLTPQALQYEVALLHNIKWPAPPVEDPATRGYMQDVAATARKACCRGLSSELQPFDVSTQQWRVHLDQYLCDMNSWTCASRDLTWLLRDELLYLQNEVPLQSHHLMQLADTNARLERCVADLQHQVDVLARLGTCSANSEAGNCRLVPQVHAQMRVTRPNTTSSHGRDRPRGRQKVEAPAHPLCGRQLGRRSQGRKLQDARRTKHE